jgi:hypothetical protein
VKQASGVRFNSLHMVRIERSALPSSYLELRIQLLNNSMNYARELIKAQRRRHQDVASHTCASPLGANVHLNYAIEI